MIELEFLTFDDETNRWWVLRGPNGAVSFHGTKVGVADRPLVTVSTADGLRLFPGCVIFHFPVEVGLECSALPAGSCDPDIGRNIGPTLRHWETTGYHDAYLRDELEELYAREFGGAS